MEKKDNIILYGMYNVEIFRIKILEKKVENELGCVYIMIYNYLECGVKSGILLINGFVSKLIPLQLFIMSAINCYNLFLRSVYKNIS